MKILVVLSRVPYPLIKGDKLRAYHHIKELSKNHEIVLCALSDSEIHPQAKKELSKYCSKIYIFKLKRFKIIAGIIKSFFNGNPLQIGYFYDKTIKKSISEIVNETKPDHIFCQLIRVSEYVKHFNIPKTLDYQDVFSKGVERRIKTASFLFKPLLKLEYKRLLKYENDIFNYFDNKIIISKPDRDLIPNKNNQHIHVIPNGVDKAFFVPQQSEKKYDLVFTGNMAYPPNVNAVIYLVNNVLPLLKKQKPNIKVLIAGAHPVKKIRDMQSENISVTGWVEDLRTCYSQSRIFIAPMQIGTGLQNKLLEAMAMQLPCVSSVLANNALEAVDGKEILLGEIPEDYVNHIITLLNDNVFAEKIAMNGYEFISKKFDWFKLTERLSDIISSPSKVAL